MGHEFHYSRKRNTGISFFPGRKKKMTHFSGSKKHPHILKEGKKSRWYPGEFFNAPRPEISSLVISGYPCSPRGIKNILSKVFLSFCLQGWIKKKKDPGCHVRKLYFLRDLYRERAKSNILGESSPLFFLFSSMIGDKGDRKRPYNGIRVSYKSHITRERREVIMSCVRDTSNRKLAFSYG